MSEFSPLRDLVFSSAFDSGNGELVGIKNDSDKDGGFSHVSVNLRGEPFTHGTDCRSHSQWFYFSLSNIAGKRIRVSIDNAHAASYPEAWSGYDVCTTFDRKYWFRSKTTYQDGKLQWWVPTETAPHATKTVYFAYFAPFTTEMHLNLVSELSVHPNTTDHTVLGTTLDGRPLDLFTFGNGPLKVWAVARQHPGESMAEWWMQGFTRRLVDDSCPRARKLRELATIRVVVNMNPDGTARGHLRTNACGANLNREWADTTKDGVYKAPSMERSPEVCLVLKELDRVGAPHLFFDVHGDEEIPDNFYSGTQGMPNWTVNPRLSKLFDALGSITCRVSPDFQVGKGYEVDPPGEANLAICADQISSRYTTKDHCCLAVTLEMPFKDTTINGGAPGRGWTPERSGRLGEDIVAVMVELLQSL